MIVSKSAVRVGILLGILGVLILIIPQSGISQEVDQDSLKLYYQAVAALYRSEREAALKLYHEALKKDSAVLIMERHQLLSGLLDQLKIRVEDDPENCGLRLEYGYILYLVDDLGEAEKQLVQVAEETTSDQCKNNAHKLLAMVKRDLEIYQQREREREAQRQEYLLQLSRENERREREEARERAAQEAQIDETDENALTPQQLSKKSELESKIESASQEVEELEYWMDYRRRQWRESNTGYESEERRRVRQSTDRYEEAAQKLEELKEELEKIK